MHYRSIQAFSNGVNVALTKPASQSSTWLGLANGNLTAGAYLLTLNSSTGYMQHTGDPIIGSWISIDLQSTFSLSSVVLSIFPHAL
jgi:hypothetical protein